MFHQLASVQSATHANTALLQGVLESLLDGVIILTDRGEWVYGNHVAHQICQRLNAGKLEQALPAEIWRACSALIESRDLYPEQPITIESELHLNPVTTFRIRVRWLMLSDTQRPYLVVLLEDCHQSLQSRAITEVQQYQLTPRQTEVWLLFRTGYSYQQIATELYISLNTVKRHMKAIHARRKSSLEL